VKRPAKELIAALERMGFEHDRTNSRGYLIFTFDGQEVSVNQGIDERSARNLLKQVERANGVEQQSNKRNATAIRERQATQRNALRSDIERHRVELDAIVAQRARQLDGAAAALTDADILRIQAHIETKERELRDIENLMRGATLSTNRAKHRA
jgi:hypothetical protein